MAQDSHDWAATRNERGHTAQPIRFQGQWHDEESGLYYNRHRYYDPQQGRYISQDPIGLQGGTNLYGYVTNPTGMVDPLGLNGWRSDHAVRDPSTNNQIINSCISDIGEWMKVPDYSGVANTRNSIMGALSRKPSVGFFAQFLESATVHGVCAHMNNNGVLIDQATEDLTPNFERWPGPVPDGAFDIPQIGIPSNPRPALRGALDDAAKETQNLGRIDINPLDYQYK